MFSLFRLFYFQDNNIYGDGYKNGARDQAIYQYRLERDDYWIKKLRTIYPYGLNDKTKSSSDDIPTGQQFPPLK